MKPFRVLQIDHVELFVPDRYEAADWYKRTLGLDIVPGYEQWAADPRGPLMISSDDGSTKLALFEGQPQESGSMSGWHLVACRCRCRSRSIEPRDVCVGYAMLHAIEQQPQLESANSPCVALLALEA